MLANTSTTTVIDIWKDTYANFPPTVADTITGSAKPAITASNKNTSTTLTGWTTSINAGDILATVCGDSDLLRWNRIDSVRF
jgi:hypothetical protein